MALKVIELGFTVGDEIRLPTWDKFHEVTKIDQKNRKVWIKWNGKSYDYPIRYEWVVKGK